MFLCNVLCISEGFVLSLINNIIPNIDSINKNGSIKVKIYHFCFNQNLRSMNCMNFIKTAQTSKKLADRLKCNILLAISQR